VVIIAKAINEAAVGSQRIVSSIKEVETVSRDPTAALRQKLMLIRLLFTWG
jgi:hypothetical protein